MFNHGRNREFQRGMETEERRRTREDERLKLRKADREMRNKAKRRAFSNRRLRGQLPSQLESQNNSNSQNNTNSNSNNNSNNNRTSNIQHPNSKVEEMIRHLDKFVQGCYHPQENVQVECCQSIRRLLSIEKNPPIDDVVKSGVVPRLIQFLHNKFNNAKLQFEAAWALTNIASGTPSNTAEVMRRGAIPHFVSLILSSNLDVAEQAVWGLGNISGDSPQCRDNVLNSNGLNNLLILQKKCMGVLNQRANNNGWRFEQCLQDNTCIPIIDLLRNVTWTLSNFCRGKPQPNINYIKLSIDSLTCMLTIPDNEILQDACWGFSYISDNDNPLLSTFTDGKTVINNHNKKDMKDILCHEKGFSEKILYMKQTSALKQLIECLGHKDIKVKHPALRAIGNVATGSNEQTQVLINMGVLDKLLPLISYQANWAYISRQQERALKNGTYDPKKIFNKRLLILKESLWLISNITAGNRKQIDSVISANIFPTLINLLEKSNFDIKKEALWCISNTTSGANTTQIKYIVHRGVIKPLCELLEYKNKPKLLLVVMEGLINILKHGDIIKHENNHTCNEYANFIEACGGLDKLEAIQANEQMPDNVFEMAQNLCKTYWHNDDDGINNDNNNNNDNTMDSEFESQTVTNNNNFSFTGGSGAGGNGTGNLQNNFQQNQQNNLQNSQNNLQNTFGMQTEQSQSGNQNWKF